jgi:hypothetical protein
MVACLPKAGGMVLFDDEDDDDNQSHILTIKIDF